MYLCLRRRHLLISMILLIGALSASICLAWAQRPGEADGVDVPIVMYHSILQDPARAGRYVLSPKVFEQDLQYLAENGYTTVTVADLIAYTQGGQLPERPVMLTFDDGHLNNLTYVLPLLERYDMKAVISVVGRYCETYSQTPDPNPNYAYLTWDDLRALADTGRFEIQNHSYDMHDQGARKGSGKLPGESDEAYRQVLQQDVSRLQQILEERCDIRPTAFTYPFGLIGEHEEEILREMGFRATLTCFERPNHITRDPDSLFGLGRYNRPSGISTEAFMQRALCGSGQGAADQPMAGAASD